MSKKEHKFSFSRFLLFQVIIIGVLKMGDTIFFFFEQNYFNTFLVQVLEYDDIYVSILVSSSAIAGLILQFVWGIISDNTRSKYGRRKPFLIFGGLIAGTSMILYAFSNNFITCFILDVVLIGIGANAYLAGERSVIPDTVEKKLRGRANGIINIVGNLGLLIALIFFLLADMLFSIPNPNGPGKIIPRHGHLVLFMVGGFGIIIATILGALFLKEKPVEELPPRNTFVKDLTSTFRFSELKNQKEFWKISGALIIFRTGSSIIMPFLFLYIFSLGMSTVKLLIVVGVAFPSLFIITYLLGKISDKYGRKRFLPIAIVVMVIGVSLTPLNGTETDLKYGMVILTIPFIMIALLGFAGILDAWSQDLFPADKRGQFNGIVNVSQTISQVIGSWVSGLVVSLTGTYRWIFLVAGGFYLLSIPFFFLIKDTIKTKETIENNG
ncbi:MAG: MFS transporter [Promethearchaeota archaeon]